MSCLVFSSECWCLLFALIHGSDCQAGISEKTQPLFPTNSSRHMTYLISQKFPPNILDSWSCFGIFFFGGTWCVLIFLRDKRSVWRWKPKEPWHAACPWWIGKDSGAKLPTAWCSKSSLENGNKKMEETNWWVLLAIFIWVSWRTLSLRIISAGGPRLIKVSYGHTISYCNTGLGRQAIIYIFLTLIPTNHTHFLWGQYLLRPFQFIPTSLRIVDSDTFTQAFVDAIGRLPRACKRRWVGLKKKVNERAGMILGDRGRVKNRFLLIIWVVVSNIFIFTPIWVETTN